MGLRQLGIVIPVLNEADNIAPLVASLESALAGWDWEALFVDDDSADGTAQEVLRIAEVQPRVRLVLRVAAPGLANSAIQGMLSSAAPVLCVMDGDGQHDPRAVPAMLAVLDQQQLDIVSAARDLHIASLQGSLGGARPLLSRIGNALVRRALGREVADPLAGFFVMRRDAFLSVVRQLGDSGFKLLFDILATGRQLRHAEVPADFHARAHGQSKLGMLTLWQFALLLVEKLSGGWIPGRLASFLMVGASGLLVHMAVLYGAMGLGGSFAWAQAAAAVSAMTFNFALNNALTFPDRRFRGWGLLRGWAAYLAVCSVGLVANVSVARWAYDQFKGWAALAALAGIAMDVMWKFVISERVLWRRRVRRP